MESVQQTSTLGNSPVFSDLVPQVIDRLQDVTDRYLDEFDEHSAFVYLIAELFETTAEDHFTFTDGPNDGGIDFFVQDSQYYSIYQCKCPTLETLESCSAPPLFSPSDVQEIASAARLILDPKGVYSVKREVQRLRADYHRDVKLQSVDFRATLAILGELTPAARERFEAEKTMLRGEGVDLRLVTWEEIFRAFHESQRPVELDVTIDLSFKNSNELMRHRDYCYVLAHGIDFYEAWRQHGWNLFDWNVRLQLRSSLINRRIMASLSTARTRKIFHHLNNGILITCRNYRIDETRGRIRLEGAQIINGCQTVCALRDAYEALSPRDQDEFREQVRIQVKVIKTTDPEFIGQLVITTNDQNPMNPRNLKSNTAEQKDLQEKFRGMPLKWFYQRKDGEWDSLTLSAQGVRWFRRSDYEFREQTGRARRRIIDNEELAATWYAWIGNSEQVLRGGLNFFASENLYNRIFLSRPNDDFWLAFGEHPYFVPTDEYFEPGMPTVYEYLLAFVAGKYVDHKRVGWQRNRQEALRRGVEQGKLRVDPISGAIVSSRRDIDEFLASDTEYRLNIVINNMRDILVELIAFLLARRYGSLGPRMSRKLLENPEIRDYCRTAFSPEAAPMEHQDGHRILGPCYAFLRYCVKQYYFENKAEMEAAPRLKAYFFARRVVQSLKELVARTEAEIKEWERPWKPAGRGFVESLPEV
ncbi:MAG: AIPR family protein [Candidatus Hadarchaeum sp.]|uniref:AIPR family protein n=1 Tax=Candidatus Hadarchaeum sp. TaxID=2883567 RepID=UPI00316DFC21